MTKEKWKELTGKEQWDCIVALRGPDCQNPRTIKWFSTAVIRGAMSSIMRVGGDVNEDLKTVFIPWNGLLEAEQAAMRGGGQSPLLTSCLSHWTQHVAEAASVLGLKTVYIPFQEWRGLMEQGRSMAAVGLVKWMKTHETSSSIITSSIIKEMVHHARMLGVNIIEEEDNGAQG